MLFILNTAGVPSVAQFVQLSTTLANQPPAGTITSPASDVTIQAGQAVTFTGTGTDPDGAVSTYAWLFPGGTPSSATLDAAHGPNPGAIAFSTPGTYVASPTVVDNQGATDPSPPTRVVTVAAAPLGVTITAPLPNATVKGSTNVKATVSGAAAGTTTFDFLVDGNLRSTSTSSGTSVSFSWNTRKETNGPHTISVSAQDSTGNTGSGSESVSVKN